MKHHSTIFKTDRERISYLEGVVNRLIAENNELKIRLDTLIKMAATTRPCKDWYDDPPVGS